MLTPKTKKKKAQQNTRNGSNRTDAITTTITFFFSFKSLPTVATGVSNVVSPNLNVPPLES